MLFFEAINTGKYSHRCYCDKGNLHYEDLMIYFYFENFLNIMRDFSSKKMKNSVFEEY